MTNDDITEFLKEQSSITVPQLQKRFSLTYRQAKAVVDELTEDGKIKYAGGVTYNVCAQDKQWRPFFARKKSEPTTLAEYMKKMRRRDEEAEAAEEPEEDAADDADLFEEDEEDGLDDLDARIDKYLAEYGDKSDGEEESESGENGGGEDDAGSVETIDSRMDKYYETVQFKKIFGDRIGDCIQSKSVKGETQCALVLSDSKYFILKFDGRCRLQISDGGLTVSAGNLMFSRVFPIIHRYKNMEYRLGEIVVTVEDEDDALTALLDLYAATESIRRSD